MFRQVVALSIHVLLYVCTQQKKQQQQNLSQKIHNETEIGMIIFTKKMKKNHRSVH